MHKRYRVARRAFLGGVGGALGLRLLLETLESAAVEAAPPPRFLLLFWPLGTIRYLFLPQGDGVPGAPFTSSPILQPFDDAGLREDMTVLYGLRHNFTCPGGGGSEAGVVFATTGANSPGTRENGGERDDAFAGGPSFDQIFLRRVPALSEGGRRSVNAICDARVDSNETSARCLSYAYDTRQMVSAVPGGMLTENVPLLPTLRPLDLYTEVFGTLAPNVGPNRLAADLIRRKSVLDHTRRELTRMRELAPSEQREKLDQHTEIIRKLERDLTAATEEQSVACEPVASPDPDVVGQEGSGFFYGNALSEQRDDLVHEQVGALHMSVIRSAFQCDLLRVATFQWASSTSHVAFHDLHSDYPGQSVKHHPMSHAYGSNAIVRAQPQDAKERAFAEFLANVHTWYNTKTAALLDTFKATKDIYGGTLFDHTVFPFVTDTADFGHARHPLPALVFGGKTLGMQGGQFLDLQNNPVSTNALWMSIARAYVGEDPLPFFEQDVFEKSEADPIDGLWRAP